MSLKPHPTSPVIQSVISVEGESSRHPKSEITMRRLMAADLPVPHFLTKMKLKRYLFALYPFLLLLLSVSSRRKP